MNVLIYTIKNCPFCIMTKEFFNSRGIDFREKEIGIDITLEKYNKIAHRTAPAIFIDDNFIGGYDQLMLLSVIQPDLFVTKNGNN
jgi:glutaredoxin 3